MRTSFYRGQRTCLWHVGLAIAALVWLGLGTRSTSLGADPGGPPRDRDQGWDEPAGPRGPDARQHESPPRGPEADGPRRFRGGEARPMSPRQPRNGEDGWNGPRGPRGLDGGRSGGPQMRGPDGDGLRGFRGGEGRAMPPRQPRDGEDGWDGPRMPLGPGGGRLRGPAGPGTAGSFGEEDRRTASLCASARG